MQHCRKFLLILAIFLSFRIGGFPVFGQSEQLAGLTNIESVKGGIRGISGSHAVEVRAVTDHIFRVRVSSKSSFRELKWALADSISYMDAMVDIPPGNDSLCITTGALRVLILNNPGFRLLFMDKRGQLINADEEGKGFGTTFIGDKVSLYKTLQEGERFVGLGEALGNLDRRGTGVTLDNTDNYRYGDPRIPMYSSIPFYIGIFSDKLYGIFFNNSYRSHFNFGTSNTRFSSATFEGGDMDYFFIHDKSIENILSHYTFITGHMPLPPMWSLGYHQSRCSYYPQAEVLRIANTFREKKIPADCIVLDADYLYRYEPFRIDSTRFPDLKGMTDELRGMGFEVTASVNPGSTIDPGYEAHASGLAADIFLRYTDGSHYDAYIEPMHDLFIDFTSPAARHWWEGQMRFYSDNGINGYWNDMNEPAVSGQRMPDNVVFDFDGLRALTGEAKNIYGMQMARASYEAGLHNMQNKRPFVLTRSGFAGVQRYAAMWSGDNMANEEHLLKGFLLTTQMGLSGMPFTGPDIGGYIGDGDRKLFCRWIEAGIFSPFLRTHREAYSAASDPWSYGEEVEAIAKSYISFRYRMLPYIYSTFHEASQTGMPVARSLCISYPFDEKVYDQRYQYQFMFGESIMVAPMKSKNDIAGIYLPEGSWYSLYDDQKKEGPAEMLVSCPVHRIPLYVKESSIIPLQGLVQHTGMDPHDTLLIHIYYGNLTNHFDLYEDDGVSFDYQEGIFVKRRLNFDPGLHTLTIGAAEGSGVSRYRQLKLILHGFPPEIRTIRVNGKKLNLEVENCSMLDPLEELSAVYTPEYFHMLMVKENKATVLQAVVPAEKEEIKIEWRMEKR